ncbi:MAG TPA: tripartite tricarboxylate transporter permease [Devosia sp.]|nr:tripartite tricarboxylate transporter permease [Devosia sp.]
MDHVLAVTTLLADWQVILSILLASAFGLFVGAVPGLSATMATALLVPITFFMPPLVSVAAIVSCAAMAITAGDIPSCLLRIPGTPASAAYTDEAYAMTQRGQPELALGISIVCSMLGGVFGSLVLMTAAPALAGIAIQFSSFEYFWLASIGLSCAALIGSSDRVKGVLSLVFGLFISCIGLDVMSGQPRFTFGVVELLGGISFIPVMIGMFAMSEIIKSLVSGDVDLPPLGQGRKLGPILAGVGTVTKRYWRNVMRGNVMGTVVGILPGAGGDIAAWISYGLAKRMSKTPEKFGTGHPEGIIEATSANNAGLSGAWVPALVFGIPGDAITAITIGVLFMKGLDPGPRLFTEQPDMLYAIFAIFLIANLLMVPFGVLAVRAARHILSIPRAYLMAIILLFCIVGSFAINNTVFDVGTMLVTGIIAFGLERLGFPLAPIILGMVLGPILEQNFMTSMLIADGDLLAFFDRPVAAVLGIVVLGIWFLPVLFRTVRRVWDAAIWKRA